MKKLLTITSKVTYAVVIGILVIIAALVAVSILPIPGGIKLFTVQSGSMEPAIWTGSVVVVQPQSTYQVNDVITFKNEEDRTSINPKFSTTHRLISIDGTNFQTKGDANDAPDGAATHPDLVIGKVLFSIPFLGFPVNFAKTKEGLLLMIIIPAIIIIYSEVISIKKEVVKMVKGST